MKHYRRLIFSTIAGLLLVMGVLVWNVAQQPIPRRILSEAAFGVWYPNGGPLKSQVNVDSIKLTQTGSDKLITFDALSPVNNLTFTEQAIPESFTDVPEVYQKMIEKLHNYAQIETANGTVVLTRPEELKGVQTAVMKSRGTLVFIRPQTDMSKDDWVRLINALSFAR